MKPLHARVLIGPQRAVERCGRDRRARGRPGGASRASVSASQGPATVSLQSTSAWRRRASPEMPAPASSRMASPNDRPSAAARRSIASNCSSVRLNRSRSISTHLPRMKASPSDCASRRLISAADSVSPSSVTSMRKSSSASSPSCDGALAADRRLHLRARGPVHAPARRHPHDHAGAFERGSVLEELQRLLRAPAQRVKDLAGIDHRLQPGALLGGALDRHQQRQQALAVLRAGIFLQGLAERQMLRLGLRRKPRRVGREEGERRFFVLAVFGEIEMHAPDQIPGGMAGLEESCTETLASASSASNAASIARQRSARTAAVKIFRAGHGRRRRRPSCSIPRRRTATAGFVAASPMPGSAHSAVT